MKRIVVFIPTYNERDAIVPLLRELLALPLPLTVLVVDDASPDGTAVRAAEVDASRVIVMRRPGPRGRGHAGVAGLGRALELGAELIVEMDGDGSHAPLQIPELVTAAATADVVIGSRYTAGGRVVGYDWKRKLNSWGANRLAKLLLGLTPRDATAGFRLFHRRVLEAIDLPTMISPGPSIVEEILYRIERQGFTIKEIPITFVNRTVGRSKIRFRTILIWLYSLLRVRLGAKRSTISQ